MLEVLRTRNFELKAFTHLAVATEEEDCEQFQYSLAGFMLQTARSTGDSVLKCAIL